MTAGTPFLRKTYAARLPLAGLLGALMTLTPALGFSQLGRAAVTHQSQAGGPLSKPAVIYVTDFALEAGQLQSSNPLQKRMEEGGRLRERLNSLRGRDTSPEGRAESLVNLMADSIVEDLRAKQINAQRAPKKVSAKTGWIVRGIYKKLEEGNRAASSQIGFGAGSPLIQVEVTLDEIQNENRNLFCFLEPVRKIPRCPAELR